jgi:tripartite-type tricarboxylate transporter receptor subunit TctC
MNKKIAARFALLAVACCALPVAAQDYPVKPVRLISPFAAGGGADTVARFFAQKLSTTLQQQVVVDNRAGAGSIIGTDLAAKAPPDGYTILIINDTHAINANLFRKLPYDPVRDFVPITLIASTPFLLMVHPSLPVKTAQDLVRLAKSKPGEINYASSGNGSVAHFAGEFFKQMAGVDIVGVQYKGVPEAMTDTIAFSKDAPPMFLVHAFDDNVSVQNSLHVATELKRTGGSAELHVYDTGGHGYGLRYVAEQPVTAWPARAAEWLARRGLLRRP